MLLYTDQFDICLAVAFPASPEEIWEDWMLLPEDSVAYIERLITGHSCVEHATAPIFAVLLLRKRIF